MGVETLRLALTGIFANKLRSGLTILGMTIGVASVIVLIAVGNGFLQGGSGQHRGARLERAARSGGLQLRRERRQRRQPPDLTDDRRCQRAPEQG